MHLYWPRLLDDSGVNRQWLGWLLSLMIYLAFLWHRVVLVSWRACNLPSVMCCADLSTLWRALRLWAEQLPYLAVIQPDRMLSIVHLYKFVSVFGDKSNFFSLLRLKRHYCAFFTTLSVWVDYFSLSVICTPRNLKLSTFSTTVPSMWIRGCWIESRAGKVKVWCWTRQFRGSVQKHISKCSDWLGMAGQWWVKDNLGRLSSQTNGIEGTVR